MKVFLTGGTGYVGSHVLDNLLEEGHDVNVLVRRDSTEKLSEWQKEGCNLVKGDILNKNSVLRGIEGVDAVINLVGIIREFPQEGITFDRLHVEATFNCVIAAQQEGVDHFLQMSALGTGEEAESLYHQTKHKAEVLVKNSDIDYTIFQPSIIFGDGGEAVERIERQVEDGKLVPMIGTGKYEWQPVHVEDVADGIVQSLDNEDVKDETVEMGGPEVYEYRELVDLIAESYDKSVIKVPVPKWLVKIPTAFFQYQRWYPLSLEMLKMLQEDNVVEGENFNSLKIDPRSLVEELQE